MSTGAPFPLVFPATFAGNTAPVADETSVSPQGTTTSEISTQGTTTTEVEHQ